jgi:nicotinamide riboside kinase
MAGVAPHDAVDRTLCLTGPECTGKTILARELCLRLRAVLVPEVAREYLAGRAGYEREDLLEIARLQREREAEARARHRGLVICDTDLLVIRIWWQEKYGTLPDELSASAGREVGRAYLLLAPDLPWTADPLRENPHDRERLFELHRHGLDEMRVPYEVVRGSGRARVQCGFDQASAVLSALDGQR